MQEVGGRYPAIPVRGPAQLGGQSGLHFDAAIFDMDGVVTDTAGVHARAWKQMFDAFLEARSKTEHGPHEEFDIGRDYLAYVDGRPRYDGVESFLASRGIRLPRGDPSDPPGFESVCGLGNSKNAIFRRIIERDGVRTFDSSVEMIREMGRRSVRTALATSSYNASEILGRTGLAALFRAVVDGAESARRGLRGKPDPDIFTAAALDIGARNDRSIVVEDAVPGVLAGVRGGFALVVGIARKGNADELRASGAGLVVRDLSETSLEHLSQLAQDRRTITG